MTNLENSSRFYTELFGLKEIARGDRRKHDAGLYVLLRDPKSGQKLELNWYPEGSKYATPYVPGEGLDHIAFAVDDLNATHNQLMTKGVEPTEIDPLKTGGWIAYVKDPDGNWIEIYQHAKPVGDSIPEGY